MQHRWKLLLLGFFWLINLVGQTLPQGGAYGQQGWANSAATCDDSCSMKRSFSVELRYAPPHSSLGEGLDTMWHLRGGLINERRELLRPPLVVNAQERRFELEVPRENRLYEGLGTLLSSLASWSCLFK